MNTYNYRFSSQRTLLYEEIVLSVGFSRAAKCNNFFIKFIKATACIRVWLVMHYGETTAMYIMEMSLWNE